LGQGEQLGQGHIVGHQSVEGISLDPQDELVLVGIAVGVFDGNLGLANTSQATDSCELRDEDRLLCLQEGMDARKRLFAARKKRIALKWQSPEVHLICANGGGTAL